MNLGDVLKGVGNEPLKDRTWTNAIVSTLNATLPTTTVLTGESTGNQALEAIGALPAAEKTRLLRSEVDLFQGTLTISTATPGSDPAASANAEAFRTLIMHTLLTDPKRSMMLVVSGVMAVVAIVVVVTMSLNYSSTGQPTDTTFLSTLIKLFLDVMKEVGDDNH